MIRPGENKRIIGRQEEKKKRDCIRQVRVFLCLSRQPLAVPFFIEVKE